MCQGIKIWRKELLVIKVLFSQTKYSQQIFLPKLNGDIPTTNSKHQTMKVMQEYIPIQYEVGKQLATSLPALFLLILEVHHLLSAVSFENAIT